MSRVAICVNPMSGRDVRRLAARATNMTFEAKRDIVARIASGIDAMGVTDIYITEEPFRIASMALEWMPLNAHVHCLKTPLNHDASDTEAAIAAFLDAGVETIVSLGGDGTNRALARASSDIDLIPLSTGTNNVFPSLIEPTVAGLVAGLSASGRLGDLATECQLKQRCKVLHVQTGDGVRDVGLIDAVFLENDFVGNLLPFDAGKLTRILLTRAEPDAIGMSPIGGFLDVVESADDCGLLLELDSGAASAGTRVVAPLSPGLFAEVGVKSHSRIPLNVPVVFSGDGVLALDGDRDHRVRPDGSVVVTIRRDGPWVFDVPAVMRHAVREGMMAGFNEGSK